MAGIPALKETYQLLKTRMDKAVEDFRANLASIRTGRASVHMLDQVKVLAYGTEMPLNQVGQISAPEPQLLLIQPYDVSLIVEVEKALRAGISVVAGISAASDLAARLAEEEGMTLVGFLRGERCTIYAHPERIALPA